MSQSDWDRPANFREQILFGVVIVVMVVSFFRVFHAPQSKQIGELKKGLSGLQMEQQALSKFLATTPKIFEQGASDQHRSMKAKIVNGEMPSAFHEIETVVTQFADPAFLGGAVIEKLSYQAKVMEKDKGWSHTDATINLVGTFSDIVGYLERLEQFPALFSVENVSFDVNETQPQELKVEVKGSLYAIEKPGGSS
jgi:hypothetical protein